LLSSLHHLGTTEITFSGGEFILRPDWRELLAKAKALGIASLIVSNGLGITRQLAAEFARQEVSCVSLSIDGGPHTHDKLRPLNLRQCTEFSGPTTPHAVSSHQQISYAIENLREAGVLVAVITQVSKANLHELPLIEAFLHARKIEGWQIQMTSPMGRSERSSVQVLEPEELPTLYAFVRRIQTAGKIRCLAADCLGYYGHDEPLLRSIDRPNDNFWRGCQAGLGVIGITSDGGIKGCLSMPDCYLEGNIREQPLNEIWRKKGAFSYNRDFRVESLTGQCRACAFGKLCRAGCHSFASSAQDGDISQYSRCIRLCDKGQQGA
jgi:radical SAM protein with 4Fe4S-binding SPASM domain